MSGDAFVVGDDGFSDIFINAVHQGSGWRSGASRGLSAKSLVLLLAGAALLYAVARIVDRMWRPPHYMRHLPTVNAFQMIWLMAECGRGGFTHFNKKVQQAARDDALRRGLIKDRNQSPRVRAQWLGRWLVVVSNPDDTKALLDKTDLYERATFADLGLTLNHWFSGENVVFSGFSAWKRHRRVVNAAFKKSWKTSLFGNLTRDLMAELDSHILNETKPVDPTDFTTRMALDALSIAAFGENFDTIHNPESAVAKTYEKAIVASSDPRLRLPEPLVKLTGRYQIARDSISHFRDYVNALIEQKIKERSGRSHKNHDEADLMDLMIEASEGSNFSREDIRANTTVFLVAGHDTTANSMAHALYFMGLHPQVQAKARAEVISILGELPDGGLDPQEMPYPTNEQLGQLGYLSRVIKETMRLLPVVQYLIFRITARPTTLSDGTCLPRGALVTADLSDLQTTVEHWGRPVNNASAVGKSSSHKSAAAAAALAFDPERFSPAEESVFHPSAAAIEHAANYAPFGGGPRVCLGMQFSIMEQKVVLACLLLRYEWELVGDDAALAGMPNSSPGFLVHPIGIQLRMTRRASSTGSSMATAA